MADVHDVETRSYNMSRVKSKDTKPEMIVRKLLHNRGFRFRLHLKDLPGKPDIVLPKYKTVVFVQGCFWHQHQGCKRAAIPKSNIDFWQDKLKGNLERDLKNHASLTKSGWRVVEIWECQLKVNPEEPINKLVIDLMECVKE